MELNLNLLIDSQDHIVVDDNGMTPFKLEQQNKIDFCLLRPIMSGTDSLSSSKFNLDNPQQLIVKHLTPNRWKYFMIEVLDELKAEKSNKQILIADLITIVKSIQQSKFVQASLQLRPFKPQFIQENEILQTEVSQSTVAQSIAKIATFKNNKLSAKTKIEYRQRITEKTLIKQFNKQYHPYNFLIKNFSRLLQLKYKHFIDQNKLKVGQVQSKLKEDLDIFILFIKKVSQPYKKLFKNQGKEQNKNKSPLDKLQKFIETFIIENSTINQSLRKVIKYAVKQQYSKHLQQRIEDFADPQQFELGQNFKIDGCYIRTMDTLIQFARCQDHGKLMKKLIQFRTNILKDINQYYANNTGNTKQLEVNAETQIQIIRFIVAKLKIWACEIYSQLKYLQLIYGEQQIAYKYQEVSFMYTQLTLAFEILQVG